MHTITEFSDSSYRHLFFSSYMEKCKELKVAIGTDILVGPIDGWIARMTDTCINQVWKVQHELYDDS